MTHIEAQSFETLKLKNLLKNPTNLLQPLEFVIHQSCTSQILIPVGKTFHYKVPSKLYRNDGLNFLVNFNLIVSDSKVSQR